MLVVNLIPVAVLMTFDATKCGEIAVRGVTFVAEIPLVAMLS